MKLPKKLKNILYAGGKTPTINKTGAITALNTITTSINGNLRKLSELSTGTSPEATQLKATGVQGTLAAALQIAENAKDSIKDDKLNIATDEINKLKEQMRAAKSQIKSYKPTKKNYKVLQRDIKKATGSSLKESNNARRNIAGGKSSTTSLSNEQDKLKDLILSEIDKHLVDIGKYKTNVSNLSSVVSEINSAITKLNSAKSFTNIDDYNNTNTKVQEAIIDLKEAKGLINDPNHSQITHDTAAGLRSTAELLESLRQNKIIGQLDIKTKQDVANQEPPDQIVSSSTNSTAEQTTNQDTSVSNLNDKLTDADIWLTTAKAAFTEASTYLNLVITEAKSTSPILAEIDAKYHIARNRSFKGFINATISYDTEAQRLLGIIKTQYLDIENARVKFAETILVTQLFIDSSVQTIIGNFRASFLALYTPTASDIQTMMDGLPSENLNTNDQKIIDLLLLMQSSFDNAYNNMLPEVTSSAYSNHVNYSKSLANMYYVYLINQFLYDVIYSDIFSNHLEYLINDFLSSFLVPFNNMLGYAENIRTQLAPFLQASPLKINFITIPDAYISDNLDRCIFRNSSDEWFIAAQTGNREQGSEVNVVKIVKCVDGGLKLTGTEDFPSLPFSFSESGPPFKILFPSLVANGDDIYQIYSLNDQNFENPEIKIFTRKRLGDNFYEFPIEFFSVIAAGRNIGSLFGDFDNNNNLNLCFSYLTAHPSTGGTELSVFLKGKDNSNVTFFKNIIVNSRGVPNTMSCDIDNNIHFAYTIGSPNFQWKDMVYGFFDRNTLTYSENIIDVGSPTKLIETPSLTVRKIGSDVVAYMTWLETTSSPTTYNVKVCSKYGINSFIQTIFTFRSNSSRLSNPSISQDNNKVYISFVSGNGQDCVYRIFSTSNQVLPTASTVWNLEYVSDKYSNINPVELFFLLAPNLTTMWKNNTTGNSDATTWSSNGVALVSNVLPVAQGPGIFQPTGLTGGSGNWTYTGSIDPIPSNTLFDNNDDSFITSPVVEPHTDINVDNFEFGNSAIRANYFAIQLQNYPNASFINPIVTARIRATNDVLVNQLTESIHGTIPPTSPILVTCSLIWILNKFAGSTTNLNPYLGTSEEVAPFYMFETQQITDNTFGDFIFNFSGQNADVPTLAELLDQNISNPIFWIQFSVFNNGDFHRAVDISNISFATSLGNMPLKNFSGGFLQGKGFSYINFGLTENFAPNSCT